MVQSGRSFRLDTLKSWERKLVLFFPFSLSFIFNILLFHRTEITVPKEKKEKKKNPRRFRTCSLSQDVPPMIISFSFRQYIEAYIIQSTLSFSKMVGYGLKEIWLLIHVIVITRNLLVRSNLQRTVKKTKPKFGWMFKIFKLRNWMLVLHQPATLLIFQTRLCLWSSVGLFIFLWCCCSAKKLIH